MSDEFGPLLLGCGVQSTVLASAIWFATNNATANRRLALVLLVLAGMTSVYVLGWAGRAEAPPWLAFMPLNMPLALGPLLYAYLRTLATGHDVEHPLRHYGPAAAHFVYCCVVLVLPASTRAEFKDNVHDAFIKPMLEAAVLGSLAAYSVAGLRLLADYRRWLADARSDADRYGARWIGRILIALLVTLCALAAIRLYTWQVDEVEVGPLYVWLGVWSAWLGIEGWRYSERRFPAMVAEAPATDRQTAASTEPDWAALGARWRDMAMAAGWWREPDLTLGEVAGRLGTNTNYLSRAINDGLGFNFNTMVNRMRAEEVARLLDAGQGGNLLQTALDAGFSSKATFNRAFREMYGHSPSTHRGRLKSRILESDGDFEASKRSSTRDVGSAETQAETQ